MPDSAPAAPPPPEAPPTLDAEGRERPAFLLSFPNAPELQELVAAYERGDFRTVRREAPELAARTDDPAVRAAALELRRRIDPSPLMLWFLAGAVCLFAFLAIWAYLEAPG